MTTCDGIKAREGEIIKDDMIYCKRCGSKKIYEFPEYDETSPFPRRVRIMCKCDEEFIKTREEEERKRIELEKFKQLQSATLLSERYLKVSFEKTDLTGDKTFVNAHNRCLKFCENYQKCLDEGYGIYLYGNCGNGKTHLMACMVNYLTKLRIPCLFTNFSEIMKEIKKTYKPNGKTESELIQRISEVPFLFIDDLGTERVLINGEDNSMQEKVYDVINKRYNAKKPTIFTSNLSIKDLLNDRGFAKKTVDRIAEMASAVIEVKGDSYRLKNRKQDLPF